ncbi:hypothetical protein [Alkalihalobacillus sp. CinArs1]|uniref:hypothetical protein n=1 Tax=Alkalihalobacillus sp. CinArs1 TaxID=2995314 RepID=UPI0022DDDD5E|nr:hypothetical protein [Alkalihalobacillus sp. CinArs1]
MKRKKMKKILVQILIVTVTFFVIRGIIEFTPIKGYLGNVTSNAVLQLYHFKDPSFEEGNMVLTYDSEQKEVANELAEEIEGFQELGVAWFGESDLPQLEVILTKQGKLPHPILLHRNGLYLSLSNIILINGELSKEERVHALSHEYAHYYLMNSIDKEMEITDLPDWFHEGVSEAFAHRFAPLPFYEAIGSWDVVPVAEMDMKGPGASERYVMAQFIVEKLLEDHGEQVVSKLIAEEQGSFEKKLTEITKQPLSDTHKWLIRNEEIYEETPAKLAEGYDRNLLKKELLEFEETKGPYYFEAPFIYSTLETIYTDEQNWEAAISVGLKRMNYVPSSYSDWKILSEYASNMGDTVLAIEYGKRGLAMTDSRSRASFEKWLEELESRS